MTLCLAWKRGHSISFASDSRLVDGYRSIVSDIATKVFTINVSVKRRGAGILFNSQYGLCFCGSYMNGSIVADTIRELLSALEVRDDTEIDAATIISIAFEIFKDVSISLMNLHRESGLSDVLIGGFCPKKKQFEVYKFSWAYGAGGEGIDFIMKQENFETEVISIGDSSAKKLADELIKKIQFENHQYKNGYTEYHVLKEIIDNEEIHGVGGAIQTGHFLNNEFRSFGMVDYEIEKIPGSEFYMVNPLFTFRGIRLSKATETVKNISLGFSKISMAPFTEKNTALEREVKTLNETEERKLKDK